jgi:hypothetical protein
VHDQLFAADNRVFQPGYDGPFEASLQTRPRVIDACSGPKPTVFAVNTNLIVGTLFSVGQFSPTQIRIDTADVFEEPEMRISFESLPCE